MQKQRDDLDIIIKNSYSNFIVSNNYNAKLLNKIKPKKNKKCTPQIFNYNMSSLKVTAASFIFGCVLIGILSVPVIQYRLVDFQYKIKNVEAFIQYNYNQNVLEYFKGE